jgi:hypothetical protein
MRTIFFSIIIIISFSLIIQIFASWEKISDEDLITQSDLVVVGKITAIKEGGSDEKDVSIATVTISDVIKGAKDIKEVKLAFPSKKRQMMASTDIFFDLNQEGVWLLRKDEKQDYYLADYPDRFQPKENAEKIKAIVSKMKSTEKPPLEKWMKETIDKWIADNNLNRYGDPKDTVYMGGTPLFNEASGTYINRYEYIFTKHPEVRKLLLEKSKTKTQPDKDGSITEEMKQKIDSWIEKNDLNKYGDSKDTMYTGGTPLFDEKTGKTIDRYEYILKKHPELLKELGLSSIAD